MHQRSLRLGFMRFLLLACAGLCACDASVPSEAPEDERPDAGALDAEAEDAGFDAEPPEPVDGSDDAGTDGGNDAETGADDADVDAGSMDAADLDAGEMDASDAQPAQDADAALEQDAATDAAAEADVPEAPTCSASSSDDSCDGVDNDCDGVIDEFCTPFSTVYDFDVRGDGAVVAVGLVSERVQIMCFRGDGSVLRQPFEVGAPDANHINAKFNGVDVARSRSAGNIVVTFGYWNFPSSPHDWRIYGAFYDDNCQLVKNQFALDADIQRPLTGTVVRLADAFMTDDGRAYLIYEHQTAQRFRVLMFDAQGERTGVVELPSATECAGGALTRVLALDRQSGKFAVACERAGGRAFRRFMADGTPIDPSMTAVDGSTTIGFAFHEFGAALNAAGTLLYFGRVSSSSSILRTYPPDPTPTPAAASVAGRSGPSAPLARVTSKGEFLIELTTETYALALVRSDASVVRTWTSSPLRFELDDRDRVFVRDGKRVLVSETITLD